MSQNEYFLKSIEQLKPIFINDAGVLFFWVDSNQRIINDNINIVVKQLKTELLISIYIHYLIKNNELYEAAYHIQTLEKIGTADNIKIIKACLLKKINSSEKAYDIFIEAIKKKQIVTTDGIWQCNYAKS